MDASKTCRAKAATFGLAKRQKPNGVQVQGEAEAKAPEEEDEEEEAATAAAATADDDQDDDEDDEDDFEEEEQPPPLRNQAACVCCLHEQRHRRRHHHKQQQSDQQHQRPSQKELDDRSHGSVHLHKTNEKEPSDWPLEAHARPETNMAGEANTSGRLSSLIVSDEELRVSGHCKQGARPSDHHDGQHDNRAAPIEATGLWASSGVRPTRNKDDQSPIDSNNQLILNPARSGAHDHHYGHHHRQPHDDNWRSGGRQIRCNNRPQINDNEAANSLVVVVVENADGQRVSSHQLAPCGPIRPLAAKRDRRTCPAPCALCLDPQTSCQRTRKDHKHHHCWRHRHQHECKHHNGNNNNNNKSPQQHKHRKHHHKHHHHHHHCHHQHLRHGDRNQQKGSGKEAGLRADNGATGLGTCKGGQTATVYENPLKAVAEPPNKPQIDCNNNNNNHTKSEGYPVEQVVGGIETNGDGEEDEEEAMSSSEGPESPFDRLVSSGKSSKRPSKSEAMGASIIMAAIPALPGHLTGPGKAADDVEATTATAANTTTTTRPPTGGPNQRPLACGKQTANQDNHQQQPTHFSSNDTNEPQMIRYLGSSMQVRSEQKATKVLGVVFFTFVICWTPFFVINFTQGFVSRDQLSRYISNELMTTFLWLGYISSTINPVIYTVFNRNFRRAFRRLILCRKAAGRRRYANQSSRGSEYYKSFRFSQYNQHNAQVNRLTNNSSIYINNNNNNNSASKQNNSHLCKPARPARLAANQHGNQTMLMLDDDQSPSMARYRQQEQQHHNHLQPMDSNRGPASRTGEENEGLLMDEQPARDHQHNPDQAASTNQPPANQLSGRLMKGAHAIRDALRTSTERILHSSN